MKFIVFSFVLFFLLETNAQKCELSIHVTDEWNENVANVHIYHQKNLLAITDENGFCIVKIDCNKKLILTTKHMSFQQERFEAYATADFDAFRKLVIKRKAYQLDEAEIKPGNNLDTVVGENQYYVEDYIFKGDSLILLLKERKTKKYFIRLADKKGEKIYEKALMGKPIKLFKDALNTYFLVYESQVFSLQTNSDNFYFTEKVFEEFKDIAQYINYVDDAKILANNKVNEKPWFEYLMLDRRKLLNDTLVYVKNETLYEQYHSEFKFLSARDRYAVRVLEYETGVSKYDIAAYYTNFAGNIWYKPANAPHFYYNDKHYFFNLCNDSLYVFDCKGQLKERFLIDFTKIKGFTGQIILDEVSGDFYTLFLVNGILKLSKIIDGKADSPENHVSLNMRYPKNVKVNKGKVWYLSRPFESWQSTYLYSEVIDKR